ncbi:hypothetical protein HDV00_012354 [Rhizophlyctis rosea]|nr:hypothetical protein HDV00_012354 [Rhizophlyctis rosea]
MGPCNPLGQPKGRLWRALRDKAEAKQLDRIFTVLNNLQPEERLCTGHYNFLNDLSRSERKAKDIEEYLTKQKRKVALGRARGQSDAPPFDTRPLDNHASAAQTASKRVGGDSNHGAEKISVSKTAEETAARAARPTTTTRAARPTSAEIRKKSAAPRKVPEPVAPAKVRKTPTPHEPETKKPRSTSTPRPTSGSRVRSPLPKETRSESVSSASSTPPTSPPPHVPSPPPLSPPPISVEEDLSAAEKINRSLTIKTEVQQIYDTVRRESVKPATPRTPRVSSIVGMFGAFFPSSSSSSASSTPIPTPAPPAPKDVRPDIPSPIDEKEEDEAVIPTAKEDLSPDETAQLRDELAQAKAEIARVQAHEKEFIEERDAELEAYRSQLALAKEESSTLRLIHEQTLSQHHDDVAVLEMRLAAVQEEKDRVGVQRKTLELELARFKSAAQTSNLEIEELKASLSSVKDQKDVLQQVSEELTQEMVNMKMRSKDEIRALKEGLERREDEIQILKRTLQEQDAHATSKYEAFAASQQTEMKSLRQQLQHTTDSLQTTLIKLTQAQTDLQTLTTERDSLRTANTSLHIDLDRSESRCTDIAARLAASIEDAKATGDRRIAEITERLRNVEDERQKVVQELREARKRVEEVERGAERVVSEVRVGVEKELRIEREKVARLEAEVETLESTLEKQKTGFLSHIDQIEEHTALHRRQWERDMTDLRTTLSTKITELESVRTTLGNAIDDLRAEKQTTETAHLSTIKEWEKRYRNSQGDVERAKGERAMVERKWKESQEDCLVLVNELDKARREVEERTRELEEVRGPLLEEMDRIREEGDKREEEMDGVRKGLEGRIAELEKSLTKALETHTTSTDSQSRLLRERSEEINRLNATLLETTDALDGARQELTGLRVALQTAIGRREEMTRTRDKLKEELGQVKEDRDEKVQEAVSAIEEREMRIKELEGEKNRLTHRLFTLPATNGPQEVNIEEVLRKACETAEGRQTILQLLEDCIPVTDRTEFFGKVAPTNRRLSVARSVDGLADRRTSVATIKLNVITGRDSMESLVSGREGRKGAELNRAEVERERLSMESGPPRSSTSSRRSVATVIMSPTRTSGEMSLSKMNGNGEMQLGKDITMSPTGELFEDVLKGFEEKNAESAVGAGVRDVVERAFEDVDGDGEEEFVASPKATRPARGLEEMSGSGSPTLLSRPTSPRSPDSSSGFDPALHFYSSTYTPLISFPSLPRHNQLTHLYLDHTSLKEIPGSALAFCPKLVVLDVSGNEGLESLPREIGTLGELRELCVRGCGLRSLPGEVGELRKLEGLDLSGNRVLGLPPTLFERMLRLEHLDLSNNQLTTLPPSLGLLSDRLQTLFIENNPFDYSFQRLLQVFIATTSIYPRPTTTLPLDTLTSTRILSARKRHIMIACEGEDGSRDRRSGGSLRSSASNESLASSVAGFGGSFVSGWGGFGSGEVGDAGSVSSRVASFDSGIADIERGRMSPRIGRHGNLSTEYLPSTPVNGRLGPDTIIDIESTNISRRPFPPGGRIQLLRVLAHLRDLYDLDPTIKPLDPCSLTTSSTDTHNRHTRHPSTTSSTATDATAVDPPGGVDEVEKLRKRQSPERRRQIVEEILATERTYVGQLQALVDIYVGRLEQGDLLSQHDCTAIFGNVRSILLVHSRHLLPDLQEAAQQPSQPLGSVFLRIAPFLKMYSLYYNNFETANSHVSQLEIICGLSSLHSKTALATLDKSDRSNSIGGGGPASQLAHGGKKAAIKKLRHFLKHAKLHPQHSQINLQAFLILPVQRLPRYKMLLEQLLDATPSMHPDYTECRKACEEVRRRVAECNENKRDAEEREKGLSVVSRIRVVEGRSLGGERVRHFGVGRRFLREGTLRVVKFVEWRGGEGGGGGGRVDGGLVGGGHGVGKRGVVQEVVGGLLETRVGDEGVAGAAGGGAAMFGVGRVSGREFRFFLFSDVLCWCRAEVESDGAGTGHELVRTFEVGNGRKAEMVEIGGVGEDGRGGGREAVVRIGDVECVVYVRGVWEEMAGWVRAINGGR